MPYKDPEKRKAYIKEYNLCNKEHKANKAKEWYEANKEITKERSKKWRLNNPEKAKEHRQLQKNWAKDNKGKINAKTARYRQTKRNNNYIVTELDKFVEQEMYELAQIRTKQLGKEWHVDHIIPLSKGGKHAIDNLQVVPAAWNLSKGNRNSNIFNKYLTQVEV